MSFILVVQDVIKKSWRVGCLATGLLVMMTGEATARQIDLKKMIRIRETRTSFDSLLRLVEKQTNAKFSYNAGKLRLAKNFHVRTVTLSLGQFLDEVRANTRLSYTIIGNHIALAEASGHTKDKGVTTRSSPSILFKFREVGKTSSNKYTATGSRTVGNHGKSPSAPLPSDTIHHSISDTSKLLLQDTVPYHLPDSSRPAISSAGLLSDTAKRLTFGIPAFIDTSIKKADTVQEISNTKTGSGTINSTSGSNNSNKNGRARNRPGLLLNLGPFFIRPGFTVDDVYQVGPTLTAGVEPFYGIVSWNSNAKISGFRYGLGTAFDLSPVWKFRAELTTGRVSRSFDFVIDTMRSNVYTANSQLHRIALQFERFVGGRFSIQGGLSFNMLRTKYEIDGRAVLPREGSPDEMYNTFKPLLPIGNNYRKNTSPQIVTWPGVQLGIFYRFNFSHHP